MDVKSKLLFALTVILLLVQTGCGGGSGGGTGYKPPDPPLDLVPGGIEGLVTTTGATPLAGVVVNLSNGRITQTAADGKFAFNDVSPKSGYSVSCSLAGYVPYTYSNIVVPAKDIAHLQPIRLVREDQTSSGDIMGKVLQSLTGVGAPGLSLRLRAGINQSTGEVLATSTTSAAGDYSFTGLTEGDYTLEIDGEPLYIKDHFTLRITAGTTAEQNFAVSPMLGNGAFQIVLTWGQTPQDLDAHLTGPKIPQDSSISGDRFHIYWSSGQAGYGIYKYNGTTYARVEHDETDRFGPETVSLLERVAGSYRFYVHAFDNEEDPNANEPMVLAKSNAVVKVYRVINDRVLIATYNVPQKAGSVWAVFELVSGEGNDMVLNILNTMSDNPETDIQ